MAQVVGALIHHEAATLHPDGVAAVEVRVEVGAVTHTLVVPTLEVSVLVEYDLPTSVQSNVQGYIYIYI